MSYLDNQQGYFNGAADTARRYNATINEWEAHANDLQRRLNQASSNAEELAKRKLFTQAKLEAQTALMETLKNALALIAPDHPLLQDPSRRKNIQADVMVKFLAQHGYSYDPQTDIVQKIRR